MHFYEHHIGDYAEATAHLSFVEDAAYCRLIRKYYATEKPLPAELKVVQRLVGARDDAEREAVEIVLNEFFELRDDGWHNARCDLEINRFIDGEPERKAKKANEKNRLKNHRDERSRLFKELTDSGLHAPWNIGINELREMVSGLSIKPPETQVMPLPETAPATPATANQYPLTTTHYPDSFNKTHTIPENEVGGLTAGSVCVFLTEQGITHTNPSHPDLLSALGGGAVLDDFAFAATEVKHKGKGFAYLLKIVLGRMEEKKNPKVVKSKTFAGFTETEINKAARPGETRDQVIQRLAQQRDKQKSTG